MDHTYINEQEEIIEFVKRAAKRFSKDKKCATYTDGEIEPECYFGVRWGCGDDCVLVLKLDMCFTPTVYGNCIHEEENCSGSDK